MGKQSDNAQRIALMVALLLRETLNMKKKKKKKKYHTFVNSYKVHIPLVVSERTLEAFK